MRSLSAIPFPSRTGKGISITIIREGRAVETGTLAELRHLRRSRITATVEREPAGLAALPGVHDLRVDGASLTLTVEPVALPEVLRRLTEAGVTALTSAPPTLEELFLDAYRTQPTPSPA